jgi:Domain of Unknown Function (DUF1080)
MKTSRSQATRILGLRGLALALVLASGGAGVVTAATSHHGAWVNLIQRSSAPLLRGWTHPGLPAGWTVHDGVLSKGGPVDDLVSTRTYRDFDLELEWNIGKEGNSGIFYRATHKYDEVYWTGPEYQLLDDQNAADGKQRLTAAGSVYAMYPAPAAGFVHPYGHWNEARIVVRGSHVTYWMNGKRIVDYDLGSPDWKKRVAASKFSAYPGYGMAPEGLIGIQGNHPGAVKIRNMRIRVLD